MATVATHPWLKPTDQAALMAEAKRIAKSAALGETFMRDCATIASATTLHGWSLYLVADLERELIPEMLALVEADAKRLVEAILEELKNTPE